MSGDAHGHAHGHSHGHSHGAARAGARHAGKLQAAFLLLAVFMVVEFVAGIVTDSLALLSATVFEGHRLGFRVIGVTVDHGLQADSAAHAARVVEWMAAMGADETASARVQVTGGGRGPEAAAREARYAVLDEMVAHFGAVGVLLGHTLDDQAETVLLGLTRGSGGRSLSSM